MKFKNYQLTDFSRAALTPGLVLGQDTGLGKTWAGYTLPFLWLGWDKSPAGRLVPKRPVLLVTPGDQHGNVASEGATHFRTDVRRLANQDALLAAITRDATGRPFVAPGFYLTSYHELTMNGVEKFPEMTGDYGPRELLARWGWSESGGHRWHAERGVHFRSEYELTGARPEQTGSEVRQSAERAQQVVREGQGVADWKRAQCYRIEQAMNAILPYHSQWPNGAFAHLPYDQQTHVLRDWLTSWLAECRDGLLEERVLDNGHKLTCVHSPAMVDLCGDFFAAVVVDEGVRMKGDDTIIGQGIRRLRPPYRLCLTGTPIKNRLPDIFWLIQWAAGMEGATSRWPYEATDEAKIGFTEEFMVMETNLSRMRSAKAKKPGRFQRRTPEACNLHRLWKLLAPVLLRRRKDDIGEGMVKKHYHRVEVPMGTTQAAVVKYHLEAYYFDAGGNKNVAWQTMALRQASACPHTTNLVPMPGEQTGPYRSPQPLTPKLMTTLRLICDRLKEGRQGVVFSAFHEPLDTIAKFLDEAGVRHCLMDGRVSPARRSRLSQKFQEGRRPGGFDLPVALCGIESVAEGHNWYRADWVIRYDLALPLDKNVQCVNRVHRLTSLRDVDIYDLVNKGTTDLMLADLTKVKLDTADLVLDGRLMGERPVEVRLNELLSFAFDAFTAEQTIAEARLTAEWPALREELRAAQRVWDQGEGQHEAANTERAMELAPVLPTVRRGLEWLRRLKL
ncbi:MAG TPA: DEAD/DEAH box helicase [Candidatus Limnocylindria bacterium]|jgi:hypothetical protein|nr:DEAD/DEAH box helicase [Candidatus Limnocylindria bacterium]